MRGKPYDFLQQGIRFITAGDTISYRRGYDFLQQEERGRRYPVRMDERLDKLGEEIKALRAACEQYEQAIGLLAELLTAVVVALPRESARYDLAAAHIEYVLANLNGKILAEVPRHLAEQLLGDLRSFVAADGLPPEAGSQQRVRFAVIRGSKE